MSGDEPGSLPSTSNADNSEHCDANIVKSDHQQLARLLEKQLEGIDGVSEKIKLLDHYKSDYRDLKRLIDKIQDKVQHPYRIPIAGSKLALVDGHIIHTNEFNILLGNNHFALRSARQADKIIDRRLADINDKLKAFEEERTKNENWIKFTEELKRDKEEFVEIIETVDQPPL